MYVFIPTMSHDYHMISHTLYIAVDLYVTVSLEWERNSVACKPESLMHVTGDEFFLRLISNPHAAILLIPRGECAMGVADATAANAYVMRYSHHN